MKKKDIIFICMLFIVLVIGYLIFTMTQPKKEVIEVYYHNQVIDTIDITKDKTYTYQGDYGKFHLEVKDGRYHAISVECPNHDCEKIGWVQEGSSQSIICVPNQIYVMQSSAQDQY